PPFTVGDFENVVDQAKCGSISFTLNGPRILILHTDPPFFEHTNATISTLKQVEWLKTRYDNRDLKTGRERFIFFITHDGAHVPGAQKSPHSIGWGAEDSLHCRRHQNMRHEDGKVLEPAAFRLPNSHGVGRRSGLESDREENNGSVWVLLGNVQAIKWRIDDA